MENKVQTRSAARAALPATRSKGAPKAKPTPTPAAGVAKKKAGTTTAVSKGKAVASPKPNSNDKGKSKAEPATNMTDEVADADSGAGRKRRRAAKDDHDDDDEDDDDDDDEGGENDTIDVDFDFTDPKEIDFHGIKSLIRQTFAEDTDKLDSSALADLVIGQPHFGTVVKVDDGLDPYALLTVLNLTEHQKVECISQISAYLLEKVKKHTDASVRLKEVLSNPTAHVGLVLNERLINMPPQLAPPLFKMLAQGIQDAVDDGVPFKLGKLIFISKVYREVESTVDQEMEDEQEQEGAVGSSSGKADAVKSSKKKKAKKASEDASVQFYFQPEDEIIERHAELKVDFKLPNQQSSDSRRAFNDYGIDPSRRIMVLPFSKLPQVIKEMEEMLV
ncbi:p21-C-terminal region-binding protein-domain-containing protein [Entophlyctis helioformis]|nr:p21-C-terminal region-binding protein-domain-containing protein [Entophlyctis helioformis]